MGDENGNDLTVAEAAALLGVRRERVYHMLKRGDLIARSSQLDRRRKLIARQAVESILLQERHAPAARRVAHTPMGEPFTAGDPLWDIVGIGSSDGLHEVATDKTRYLAEAYADRGD